MILENEITQNIDNKLKEFQESFLQTDIGQAINSAVDIGLKTILPDLIEDQIIDIKNAILENGFKEGINEVITSAINTGKSFTGVLTGNFENISQIQLAVKTGGILDKTSELLDYAINLANKKDLIDRTTTSLIKNGKNTLISSISNKIEETLTNQLKAVEKIEKYSKKWNESLRK